MEVISAKEAKARGLKLYYTGKPCSKGHITERLVHNLSCVECQKLYRKKSDAGRRDKINDYQNRYREDPEVRRKARAYGARHRAERPESYRAATSKRRAKKLCATPPWLTAEQDAEMQELYAWAQRIEEATSARHHVDHIIPLQHPDVCGLHVPWNLRIITERENTTKGNRFDREAEEASQLERARALTRF